MGRLVTLSLLGIGLALLGERFLALRTFHNNGTHRLLATPITSRRRWASKRLLMEFVSHLGKKLLLPGLLIAILCELDMQDPQRNDC